MFVWWPASAGMVKEHGSKYEHMSKQIKEVNNPGHWATQCELFSILFDHVQMIKEFSQIWIAIRYGYSIISWI